MDIMSGTKMTPAEFRGLRKGLGYSQVALADALGCSWITVSRIENGTSVPRLYELAIQSLALTMVPQRDAA